jgi:hypothetical protein
MPGLIKNAETGEKSDYELGSVDEMRFFRVIRETDYVVKPDGGSTKLYRSAKGAKFYFDDPSQYEMVVGVKLSDDTKADWREMVGTVFPGGVFSEDGYKRYAQPGTHSII